MEGEPFTEFDSFRAERERRLAAAKKERLESEDVSDLKDKSQVKAGDFAQMMFVALFFDGLQAILSPIVGVGWILSSMIALYAWLTFTLWSSWKGVGIPSGVRGFIVKWIVPLVEFVPIVNILPTWTLRIFLQLSFVKAEELVSKATGGKLNARKAFHIYSVYNGGLPTMPKMNVTDAAESINKTANLVGVVRSTKKIEPPTTGPSSQYLKEFDGPKKSINDDFYSGNKAA